VLSGVEIKKDTFVDTLLLEYQSIKQISYVASVLLMSPHCDSPASIHNIFLKTALPSIKGENSLEEAFDKYFGKQ